MIKPLYWLGALIALSGYPQSHALPMQSEPIDELGDPIPVVIGAPYPWFKFEYEQTQNNWVLEITQNLSSGIETEVLLRLDGSFFSFFDLQDVPKQINLSEHPITPGDHIFSIKSLSRAFVDHFDMHNEMFSRFTILPTIGSPPTPPPTGVPDSGGIALAAIGFASLIIARRLTVS